ncbi:MAG: response regulator [Anaerolineae bacterium]
MAQKEWIDYYAELGLSNPFTKTGKGPKATPKEIRAARNKQIDDWHPDNYDLGTEAWHKANEKCKRINVAYRVLRNPEKKEVYDREWLKRNPWFVVEEATSSFPPEIDETVPYSILIVEDDSESMALLTAILKPEGYTVYQAGNGEQAMIRASIKRPDLILMDIMMPGVDGLELARRFKAHPEFKDIPIVMVSSYPTKGIVLRSLKVGASDFIVKPIRRQVVLEKLQRVLSVSTHPGH